mgnify:CR=1 FL=1
MKPHGVSYFNWTFKTEAGAEWQSAQCSYDQCRNETASNRPVYTKIPQLDMSGRIGCLTSPRRCYSKIPKIRIAYPVCRDQKVMEDSGIMTKTINGRLIWHFRWRFQVWSPRSILLILLIKVASLRELIILEWTLKLQEPVTKHNQKKQIETIYYTDCKRILK